MQSVSLLLNRPKQAYICLKYPILVDEPSMPGGGLRQ